MAGYTAMMRLDQAAPRVLPGRALGSRADGASLGSEAIEPRAAVEDVSGEPFASLLSDKWADLRDAVGQTTFFLTDPNSWR
jgi:hypothetical protein